MTTSITSTEYRNLPLAVLTESKANPRRIFEDSALKELADSIRSQGVLSPLLVRPLNERSFEIVAGARRYRAAQMAESETVPVRIVQLTDAEALEAQLIENLQRRDVHPLEEAQGFRALLQLEEPKYSIEQIAARTGKTPAHCAQRIKLTELAPAVVEAFYKDEIGVGHALLLAKLQPEQQQQALAACFREDWGGGSKSKRILLPVRNLQQWIEANILLILKDAPFDTKDVALVPAAGSCLDCPKRTGQNKLLFADVRQDACTSPDCYQSKVDAHVAKTIAAKPKLVQITTAYGKPAEGSPVIPRNQYVEIRQEKPQNDKQRDWPEYKTCMSTTEAHHHRRHGKGRDSQNLCRPRLSRSPSEEAAAETRCQPQSRAGKATPRGSPCQRHGLARSCGHRRRCSRAVDETRPAFHRGTSGPNAGRTAAGACRPEPRHQEGKGQRLDFEIAGYFYS